MKQVAQTGMINRQAQNVSVSEEKPKTLKEFMEIRMGEIQKVLPSVISPEQFLRLTLNALQNTPHLAECSVTSFYASIMTCAQLGLKPNVNGEGYLLPYKNNKKGGIYECQFIPGYRGLMILARRSGEIQSIDAQTVYENDVFDLGYGFEPTLIHKPFLKGSRGAVIGYYASVILKDGGKNAYFMTVDDAKKYGQRYSKTFSVGPWTTDFDAMAKKSCLRQVLKYAPTSTDVENAMASDARFEDRTDGMEDITAFEENPMIEADDKTDDISVEMSVDSDGVISEEYR